MWWRYPYKPIAYDDDWEDQPTQGAFYKWGLGVCLATGLAIYGARAILMKQVEYGGEVAMTMRGLNAIATGIASIAAGLFMHCHYFWGNIYDQAWFAVLGKIIAGIAIAAGLIFVLIHNGVLGIN